jgi:hypothetical protein
MAVEVQPENTDLLKASLRRMTMKRCARLLTLLSLAASLPVFAADADRIFIGDFDPPPDNDICETAKPLTLGPEVLGTTHDATSNYNSGLETCTAFEQPGQDVVYSISMVAGSSYSVNLVPEASFDASISLLGPGTPGVCNVTPVNCVAGADFGFDGDPESFMFTAAQTGTYYIIVDSFLSGETGSGSFSIQVTSP